MKFLITGGAGFIGSHLAKTLHDQGHSISILDNLSTGTLNNLKNLLKSNRVIFKKGSVLNQKILAPLFKDVNAVFHLAASVGVKVVMEEPLKSFLNNTDGTKNILDLALARNIPILIASTSEVYGKSKHVPYQEESDRLYGSAKNMRWGYALSKSVDEFLALCYAREKNLKCVIVRFFNTVGPAQTGRYGMVIPRFIEAALSHKPIPVYGDGKQVRCFCHVEDSVSAISKLLLTKKAYGEIFNVGSEEPITINRLARKIKEITGSKSQIAHIPKKIMMEETGDEMKIRIPNISKIKKILGWSPAKNFNEIIQDVVQYKQRKIDL